MTCLIAKKVVEDSSVGRAERRWQRRGGGTVVSAVLPELKEVRPGCRTAAARLLYMMYKCECLLGWWVEDAPRLFCQKTSLLRARKMMIIFISSRVMLKFVYRSWKQNDFFISHQLNWYNHHNQRSFIILLLKIAELLLKIRANFRHFWKFKGLPLGILFCPKIAKRHLIWSSQPAPQNKHKTN